MLARVAELARASPPAPSLIGIAQGPRRANALASASKAVGRARWASEMSGHCRDSVPIGVSDQAPAEARNRTGCAARCIEGRSGIEERHQTSGVAQTKYPRSGSDPCSGLICLLDRSRSRAANRRARIPVVPSRDAGDARFLRRSGDAGAEVSEGRSRPSSGRARTPAAAAAPAPAGRRRSRPAHAPRRDRAPFPADH